MLKGRHFDRTVILLCIRWYLAYNLSLRNLEEMLAERGISVDHATIHRLVVRYSPELLKRFNACKRAVAARWHVDARRSCPAIRQTGCRTDHDGSSS
jgi:transposase-like protein